MKMTWQGFKKWMVVGMKVWWVASVCYIGVFLTIVVVNLAKEKEPIPPAIPQTIVIKNLVIEVEAGNIRLRNFRAAYERPSFWFEGAEVQEKEESDADN